MNILHIMLACFYVDNYNYQENILPRINKLDGHNVKIIASTETFIDNIHLGYLKPSRYYNENGIEVIRLPYKKNFSKTIERKLRTYVGLYKEIESFKPDIILCHGLQFKDLDVIGKYKRTHNGVKIFADSHEDNYNSATSFLSRNILYRFIYNPVIKRNLKYIETVLCIAKTSIDFMNEVCMVPKDKLEIYPLGGFVNSEKDYLDSRATFRKLLNVSDDEIVMMHSGKLYPEKKTRELLLAFNKINDPKFRLVIIGSIPDDSKAEMLDLINSNNRISYLGWKTGQELLGYLTACDIYIQPGTQSATMQNAACARAALILYPFENHTFIFGENALYAESTEDLTNIFIDISKGNIDIKDVRKRCFRIAKEKLDYESLVNRLYN